MLTVAGDCDMYRNSSKKHISSIKNSEANDLEGTICEKNCRWNRSCRHLGWSDILTVSNEGNEATAHNVSRGGLA